MGSKLFRKKLLILSFLFLFSFTIFNFIPLTVNNGIQITESNSNSILQATTTPDILWGVNGTVCSTKKDENIAD